MKPHASNESACFPDATERLNRRRFLDCALTTILSREATMRRSQLTMDGLIRENRRMEPDLKGLKA